MGNFYADVMRATFLVLLPLCLVTAGMLVLGGVIMTFDGSVVAQTLEGAKQIIARGPVAAFVTIKQLGTNGGGFFGPNSTHPFENASFFTNFIETMSIIVIPMACVLDVRAAYGPHEACGRDFRGDAEPALRQAGLRRIF